VWTKTGVFDESSLLSGAVKETMERQIAHKGSRKMWKGEALSITK